MLLLLLPKWKRWKIYVFLCFLVPPGGNLTPEQNTILRELLATSKEKLRRLTAEHRELHGFVSKVGKTIDRNFVSDLSSTTKTDVLLEDHNIHLLNKVIAQHFYRQGMDDVADSLIQVALFCSVSFNGRMSLNIRYCLTRKQNCQKKTSPVNRLPNFTEYGNAFRTKILRRHWTGPPDTLKSWWPKIAHLNLSYTDSPICRWVGIVVSFTIRMRLSAVQFFGMNWLEFHFCFQILLQGINAQTDALKYARTHFAKFVNIFQKDIQILMGALMYLPVGIENSPYRTLIAPEMWIEVWESCIFSPHWCDSFMLELVSFKGCRHILKGCLPNTRNY